jgi:hypothetical protein
MKPLSLGVYSGDMTLGLCQASSKCWDHLYDEHCERPMTVMIDYSLIGPILAYETYMEFSY